MWTGRRAYPKHGVADPIMQLTGAQFLCVLVGTIIYRTFYVSLHGIHAGTICTM